jgi:hypothetical protein
MPRLGRADEIVIVDVVAGGDILRDLSDNFAVLADERRVPEVTDGEFVELGDVGRNGNFYGFVAVCESSDITRLQFHDGSSDVIGTMQQYGVVGHFHGRHRVVVTDKLGSV